MRTLIFIGLLCLSVSSFGQNVPKHDYHWIFGLYPLAIPNPMAGNTQLDFHSNIPSITYFDGGMRFRRNNIAMSDVEGELLFYFNGTTVWNKNYEVLLDSIDEGQAAINPSIPNASLQGCIVLPYPEHDSLYMLIYGKMAAIYDDTFGFWLYDTGLRYSLIDMSCNGGLGCATEKDVHISDNDTLSWGKLNAVKHANGRDWWVVIPRAEFGYQLFLLSPNGIEYQGFKPEFDYPNGSGLMNFSPDGTKCVATGTIQLDAFPDTMVIYNFDRCDGSMSTPRWIIKTDNNNVGGFLGHTFSPDGRYLYWSRLDTLFQYDTYAEDMYITEAVIAISTIYNGFNDPISIGLPAIGPDGKIYFSTTDASDTTLQVLPFPNRAAPNTGFCYDCIRFEKVYWYGIPHYPNYRLGPIDGSGCDTLGINNEPRANFRYDWETPNGGLVTFTDNSAYEPAVWAWDFGDFSTSSDTSPVHQYAAAGVYQVCLTVSNPYGSDTFCREVVIDSVTAVSSIIMSDVSIIPNPAKSLMLISLPDYVIVHDASVVFSNMLGQVLLVPITTQGSDIQVDVSSLPSGLYFCTVSVGNKKWVQKVVVAR